MKKIISSLLLVMFCISSMPVTFAESVKGVDLLIDNLPKEGFFISEEELSEAEKIQEEMADLEYEIVDPYMDKFEHGDGRVSAKIYSAPRPLVFDESTQSYEELPEGYSYFGDYNAERNVTDYGYKYFIGNGKELRLDEFSFASGAMTFGDVNQMPLNTERELTDEGVKYRGVYPGIDIEFKDGTFSREKFITINEKPEFLPYGEELIFNEVIEIPDGAKVMIGDPKEGELLEEEKDVNIGYEPFFIVMEDGSFLRYGNSFVYDDKAKTVDDIDAQGVGVDQVLLLGSQDENELVVRQVVTWEYLMDDARQYPVTVDPALHYCRESVVYKDSQYFSSGCSMDDFYSRSPEGGYYDHTTALFMGKSASTYRLPVFKFYNLTNYVPQGSTINGAWLNTFYRNEGTGTFNKDTEIYFTAKMIDASWNSRDLDYLLANTSQIGGTTGISDNPGREYTWYIKDMVDSWVANPSTNYGVLLSQNGAKNTWENRLHSLYSSRHSNTAERPFLSVSYTEPNAPSPDIEIVDIQQVTSQLAYNQPFQVRVWVRKNGTTTSDYKVRVNLGDGRNDTGPPAETKTISANAASTSVLLFNLTPSVLYQPMRDIRVEVDWDNDIQESNENNNVEIKAITSPTAPSNSPDLVAQNISLRDPIMAQGHVNRAYIDIENTGQTNAGRFRVGYYISPTNNFANAQYLDEDYISSLAAGATRTVSESFALPISFAPGSYYIFIKVDADDDEVETNENNNILSIPVEVRADAPEVGIFSTIRLDNYPNGLKPGDTMFAGVRIYNISDYQDAVGMSYILILVEESSGLEFPLLNQNPATFDVPRDSNAYLPAYGVIPNLPASGNYKIRAIIDHLNQYAEINEVDNTKESASFAIQVPSNRSSSTIYNGNYGQTPADASNYNNSNGNTTNDTTNLVGDPVNIRTGHFDLTNSDLLVDGVGQPVLFKRTYNSKWNDVDNRFGAGWSHSYNVYYYQDPATMNVRLYHGGNLANTFTTSDGGLTFEAPEGSQDTLMVDNGNLVYKTLNGMKFVFGENVDTDMGVLTEIEDTNGNKTILNYMDRNGIKLLDKITDPSGREVLMTYGDTNDDRLWDNIVKVESTLGSNLKLENTYTYDVTSDPDRVFLLSATQNRSYQGVNESIVRSFTYDTEGRMESYTDPRGTRVRNVYDAEARVVEQYMHNPRVHTGTQDDLIYTYDYTHMEAGVGIDKCTDYREIQNSTEYSGTIMCFNAEELKVLEKDHLGNVTRFEYNSEGLPTSVTDQNGNQTTFAYDNLRRLVRKNLPDTDYRTEISYKYENVFNKVIEEEQVATDLISGQVVSRLKTYSYDGSGNMTQFTDFLGNATSYTYDSKGNVLSSTDPNGAVTTYTYDSLGNYLLSESMDVTDLNGTVSNHTISYTYDVFGNMTSKTDQEGNTWDYEYDNLGNLRRQINPDNSSLSYEYDLENNLVRQVDENGNVTDFEIDGNLEESQLATIQRSANGDIEARKEFTQLGREMKSIDPNGNIMSHVYDAANRKIQDVTPVDVIDYIYDSNGNMIESENSLGQRTTYEYDARDQLLKTKRHGASVVLETVSEYDGFGRLVAQIDPNGNKTTYVYDLADRLVAEVDPLGNRMTYAYDAKGNVIESTDQLKRPTKYRYDELDRLIVVTDTLGRVSTKEYDKRGLLIREVDRMKANGALADHVTVYQYDNRGRLIRTIFADGSNVLRDYDDKGNLTQVTDQLGRKTTYTYDDFDRVVSVRDNDGFVTQSSYDDNGNLVEVINANGNSTVYRYDGVNRLGQTVAADRSVSSVEYDSSSNVLARVDYNGNVTRMEYDDFDRVVREFSPMKDETFFEYDKNGNMLSEIRGQVRTNFEYDALDRLIKQNNPHASATYANRKEEYTYDERGNVIQFKNQRGGVIRYEYDDVDRLTRKTKPEGVIRYEYDNWDNLVGMEDETGYVAYEYDQLNRNTIESREFKGLNKKYILMREYFADGQLAGMIDPFGNVIQYEYDNRGLKESIDLNNNEVARYEYDGFGNLVSEIAGNGVETRFRYDKRERNTVLDASMFNANNPVFEHIYEYDADGNRVSLVENGDRTKYSYDALNQLVEVESGNDAMRYFYREFGWLSGIDFYENSRRMGYRRFNQWTRSNQHAYTVDYYGINNSDKKVATSNSYDSDGNLRSETIKNNTPNPTGQNYNFVKRYNWDSENRLKEVTVETYKSPADKTSIGKYEYDDFGNRTVKESKNELTYYFNDGLNVLNEIDQSGELSSLVIMGVDGILAEANLKEIRYMHTDVQGTTRLVTNHKGEILGEYKYEPFGELAGVFEVEQGGDVDPLYYKDMNVKDGEMHLGYDTVETDYLYTGQEFDDESGLMYYNARYYNPVTGRFISRDSYLGEIGDTLSRSRYVYVKNNPYRYVDPTGNFFVKHNTQQTFNALDWISGVGEAYKGAAKGAWGELTGNDELVGDAYGDIVSGYLKTQKANNDMKNDWNDFSNKTWSERWDDDVDFGEEVATGIVDSALGVETAYSPDFSYYKDTVDKATGSITQEFSPPQVDMSQAYLIGAVAGNFLPGGKDKKAKNIYGLASDTIEASYKKNKGKIDDVLDYFRKNEKSKPGYKDVSDFENREKLLPGYDSKGNKITYEEQDIDPRPGKGKGGRNADRIVTGSDGKIYYTDSHYTTFIEITDR